MRLIYVMLFVLPVVFCCCKTIGQTKPSLIYDPYFVESTDTVSEYGPWHITRDLLQDRHGDYWFATWLGIVSYDGKLFTNHTLKDNLIHFHVVCCYEDTQGNLWFGTARGGVYRYDGKVFKLFTTKDGLVDNNVSCITEDKTGNIWLGTENGASRFDGNTFTNFTVSDGLASNNIGAIMQDKSGKLWFGCQSTAYKAEDGGISCYDGKAFVNFTNEEGKPFTRVTSLLEDRKGNIWIGGFDGLTRYDGKTLTSFLTNLLTYYMIEDKAGNIWMSHSEKNTNDPNLPNQVLYKYDGKVFTKIIEKDKPNDFQIFGKTVDRNGHVWFGTMHGPCRYDGKTFTYFTR